MSLLNAVQAELSSGATGAESIARRLGTDTFLVERALVRLLSQQLFVDDGGSALASCSGCKVLGASAMDDAVATAVPTAGTLPRRACGGCPLAR